MSIAVIQQVYEETRRLAIGGTALAKGDFRLKKLVAPLEQSAQKAPVFGQVAKAIDKVISSDEKAASTALLDLSSLVLAILYTQGKTASDGDVSEIKSQESFSSGQQAARVLEPLIKALSTKGPNRLGVVHQAYREGVFSDARLMPYAIGALNDSSVDICELIATEVLPAYGKAIFSEVAAQTDVKGMGGDARRLKLLYRIDPQAARPMVLDALENGSKQVRVVAVECLGALPEDLPYLLTHAKSKAGDVRERALMRLGPYDDDAVVDVLMNSAKSQSHLLVKTSIRGNKNERLIKEFCEYVKEVFDSLFEAEEKSRVQIAARVRDLLDSLKGRDESVVIELLSYLYQRYKVLPSGETPSVADAAQKISALMLESRDKELRQTLVHDRESLDLKLFENSFAAGTVVLSPQEFYDTYAPLFIDPGPMSGGRKDRRIVIEGLLNEPRIPDKDRPRYLHHPKEIIEDLSYLTQHARWDKRWIDTAIKVDSLKSAIAFGDSESETLKKFLNDRLNQIPETNAIDESRCKILIAMVAFNYPEATDRIAEFFRSFPEKDELIYRRSHLIRRIAQQIASLPLNAISVLETLLLKLNPLLAEFIAPELERLKNANNARTSP